ncbi:MULTISPECIES: response regulator [Acinetobacter calcoaceticus/baumannii complex]|uniref:response regulator n=1 Tax=Acinetobacter calcoaceticus/baumannii complex TaxID=909768 RepID=UPI000297845A|nr:MULTISPECIES: response regulator [Acinetobacter calcoaceticus/baumannii complex]AVI32425.1 response regulator [Acinetobacter baumannii]AVI38058.1 response regulator [Acinetobacter baumannii]EHU1235583.1 response regulator [Acinetobacter baumannii]EHU1450695.1 response regulator [Acinetobacter baumannii]EHU1570448.1 response regulator [Acinetobacter baumannii]
MIYIVEDSDLKIQKIESFLLDNGYTKDQINIYRSYQSGVQAILKNPPDLVILDMSIPTFDKSIDSREGRARPLGGYDVMKKILFKQINTKVIVLTQLEFFGEGVEKISFEQLKTKCAENFSDIFLDCIYYSPTESSWCKSLLMYLSD